MFAAPLRVALSSRRRSVARVVAWCLPLVLLGCGAPQTITAGPGAASAAQGLPVSTHVVAIVERPVEDTWNALFYGGIPLNEILEPTEKVPGVERTTMLDGGQWDREGAYREVWLTSGDRVEEQITHMQAPHYFSYRTWDLPEPLAGRVDHIRGEWWLEAAPEGTRIVWQYSMVVERRSTKPFVAGYLRRHMQPYMNNAMNVVKREIEALDGFETSASPGA